MDHFNYVRYEIAKYAEDNDVANSSLIVRSSTDGENIPGSIRVILEGNYDFSSYPIVGSVESDFTFDYLEGEPCSDMFVCIVGFLYRKTKGGHWVLVTAGAYYDAKRNQKSIDEYVGFAVY